MLEVMNKLKSIGIDSVCAGGYPRDMMLGRKPKDIDLIIWGNSAYRSPEIEKVLQSEIEELDDYSSTRIAFVIKVGNVDVICYLSETLQEALDCFDYNINQYILEDGKPKFMGKNEFTLTEVRGDEKRLPRMKELAKGWNQCEEEL